MHRETILTVASICFMTFGLSAPDRVSAQTELDRIVGRVNNRVITQSDIREAMLLRLVDDASSDESTRRSLENRLLILTEISRLPPLPPASESDLAARRAQWEAGIGGRSQVSGLLGRTGLNESALDAWFRDDVRIQMLLKQQFGSVPESDRARATSDWIARLRQRAGLK